MKRSTALSYILAAVAAFCEAAPASSPSLILDESDNLPETKFQPLPRDGPNLVIEKVATLSLQIEVNEAGDPFRSLWV